MPTVTEVYTEDAAAVSAIEFPEGCEPELPAGVLAGTTVQWSPTAPDEDRRAVVAGLVLAVSGDVDANEVAAFLDAVGTERWWLGEVFLLVSRPDGKVLLLPGSDGALLHVVYSATAGAVRQAVTTALARDQRCRWRKPGS